MNIRIEDAELDYGSVMAIIGHLVKQRMFSIEALNNYLRFVQPKITEFEFDLVLEELARMSEDGTLPGRPIIRFPTRNKTELFKVPMEPPKEPRHREGWVPLPLPKPLPPKPPQEPEPKGPHKPNTKPFTLSKCLLTPTTAHERRREVEKKIYGGLSNWPEDWGYVPRKNPPPSPHPTQVRHNLPTPEHLKGIKPWEEWDGTQLYRWFRLYFEFKTPRPNPNTYSEGVNR